MRRRAKVVEGGEIATIEIMRSSACDGCHKNGGGCVSCDIFGLNKTITAKAENRVGAAAGDRVIIETESGRVIGYAAVVFLLPIVVALALYFAAGLFG
ncbi:MAG: SoxR reducing system RseC family protein, partial [Clostridiales bacterium]|nr:SoxR reducing system RseC family protein [Clostridiales bacterium]